MAGWRSPFRGKFAKSATGSSECQPLKGKALLNESAAEGLEEANVRILSFFGSEGNRRRKGDETPFEKTDQEKGTKIINGPDGGY